MYIAEAGEKNDGNHHCPIFLLDGWVVSAEKEAGGGQMYKHIFFTLSKYIQTSNRNTAGIGMYLVCTSTVLFVLSELIKAVLII